MKTRRVVLSALFMCACVSAPVTSWSFETDMRGPAMSGRSVDAVDQCRALYLPHHARTAEIFATPSQQSVGGAALGLIFGVHSVAGPLEETANARRVGVRQGNQGNQGYALAIVQYRACRKERSLQHVADNF